MKKTLISIIIGLLAYSCTSTSSKVNDTVSDSSKVVVVDSALNTISSLIVPPLENINVPFEVFTVNAVEGAKIETKYGSVITIPAKAFESNSGQLITEPVVIKYRELETLDEIFASGIPMIYQHDGIKENFISAGMFEIDGSLMSGEKVKIATDKTLEVNMASRTSVATQNINFYELVNQKQWVEKSPSVRTELILNNKSTESIVPVKLNVSKAKSDAYKFELNADYSKIAELKDYKDIIWQYVDTVSGFDNPNTFDAIHKEKWTSVNIENYNKLQKLYKIQLKSKSRVFVTIVTPVMGEKAYKKALIQAQLQNSKVRNLLTKIEQGYKMRQAVSLQLATVSNFGIYNHDYFYRSNSAPVIANVDIKLPENQNWDNTRVFLISKNNNAIIEYSTDGYDKLSQFTYNPNDNNGLMVVYPENKVSVLDRYEFKKQFNGNTKLNIDLSKTTTIKDYRNLQMIIENI